MGKKIFRRSFIKKAILTVISLEAAYLIFDVFKNKSNPKLASNLFSAGKADFFEKNKMYPFNSGKFYLSVFEDGGMLAISIKLGHFFTFLKIYIDN